MNRSVRSDVIFGDFLSPTHKSGNGGVMDRVTGGTSLHKFYTNDFLILVVEKNKVKVYLVRLKTSIRP